MSQDLLGAILFPFHHLHCTALKGCTCAEQQAAYPHAIHRDCRIVALPPVHAVITHVLSYIRSCVSDMMHCI